MTTTRIRTRIGLPLAAAAALAAFSACSGSDSSSQSQRTEDRAEVSSAGERSAPEAPNADGGASSA
ncbi:MAG: hypothetical protein L0H31_16910, partial [Nocardioidaceae bacterium]|nr:hypothetical protein [Nocardioidaceae bacterium]